MSDQPGPSSPPPPHDSSSVRSDQLLESSVYPSLDAGELRRRKIREELGEYQEDLTTSILNLPGTWSKRRSGKRNPVDNYVRELVERHQKKRLFVCCDGTWKNASGTIAPLTNVAKLARCVDRIGSDELDLPTNGASIGSERGSRFGVVRQLVYYSSGVGTQSSLAMDSGISGATGHGVTANILSAYCFICNNYNFSSKRDEIILVGFSRGAFTVRCLAAFISKVGLLRRKGLPFLRLLFDHWRRQETKELSKLTKALNPLRHDVRIKVLAEWDPVSAMGLPFGLWTQELSFVDDEVPHIVDNAFVALALNEKRPSFEPLVWTNSGEKTTLKQCGFIGSHSDIGGGNPDSGLSTISLLWMISQIGAKCNAQFDSTALLQFLTPLQYSLLGKERLVGRGKKRKLYLKNLSSTEGHVHESLTGLWLIPKYLSLGLWRGERHATIDRLAQCGLTIHFTVHIFAKDENRQLRCGFFKRYKPEGSETSIRWVPRDSNFSSESSYLPEETLSDTETRLLGEWLEQAESWRQYEGGEINDQLGEEPDGEPDGELDGFTSESTNSSSGQRSGSDYDTRDSRNLNHEFKIWPRVIRKFRNLGFKYISGCKENESLICRIQQELEERKHRRTPEHEERQSEIDGVVDETSSVGEISRQIE